MQVYVAGNGKLASELMEGLTPGNGLAIARWLGEPAIASRSIVVHAGSGREIDGIANFCQRTSSVLIELATGSSFEGAQPNFPVVLCPNTNILMLKFMCMLERSGPMFKGFDIRITESHQATKSSVPGTAVAIANSLGVAVSKIMSIRDTAQQLANLKIPQESLARHAFHQIQIHDGPCTISLETRVYGDSPYASGVQKIVGAIQKIALQSRVYSINEFIENGWL